MNVRKNSNSMNILLCFFLSAQVIKISCCESRVIPLDEEGFPNTKNFSAQAIDSSRTEFEKVKSNQKNRRRTAPSFPIKSKQKVYPGAPDKSKSYSFSTPPSYRSSVGESKKLTSFGETPNLSSSPTSSSLNRKLTNLSKQSFSASKSSPKDPLKTWQKKLSLESPKTDPLFKDPFSR